MKLPNKALFDTNILIDHLNDVSQATLLLQTYEDIAISPITWIEVMVGASSETERAIRDFLLHFTDLPIDERVSEIAAALRRKHRVKLPDAIIWATARANNRILVTRNTKDFPNEPGIYFPYRL